MRQTVISGEIGPRGDGYRANITMTEPEAYHAEQIGGFAETYVDMVISVTLSTVAEGVGMVRAAQKATLPIEMSCTVEPDGSLRDGTPLGLVLEETDVRTNGAAAYFTINCAHPDHVHEALAAGAVWVKRIGGRPGISLGSPRSHLSVQRDKTYGHVSSRIWHGLSVGTRRFVLPWLYHPDAFGQGPMLHYRKAELVSADLPMPGRPMRGASSYRAAAH